MGCHFCKQDIWEIYCDANCDYMICWLCWSELPQYISTGEQVWKLIQMRGDKICETL